MIPLALTGSVGAGGVNRHADVLAVRERLAQLGYGWVGAALRDEVDGNLRWAIGLFQSICLGRGAVAGPGVDSRVDVGGVTHRWLQAINAPRWMRLPVGAKEMGFVCWDRIFPRDEFEWGSSWLADAIAAAGRAYYLGRYQPAAAPAPIVVNDASTHRGGPNSAHQYHQTGLECDLRLPRSDGWAGEITWSDRRYDRAAMRAQLEAFRSRVPHLRAIFFNDPELVSAGLCHPLAGHDDHAHLTLRAPVPETLS